MTAQHNIRTIEEIISVATEDNIDSLLIDFGQFLNMHVKAKQIKHLEMSQVFMWIDDGDTGVKGVNLHLKSTEQSERDGQHGQPEVH